MRHAAWALAIGLALPGITAALAGEVRENLAMPSDALGRDLPYSLYLPDAPDGEARFPVVYLLHGYGGGQREWLRGGRLEATLDRLIADGTIEPVIAVMPEAGKSWYVDSAAWDGPGDYETAIARDLVAGIDARYPTRPGRDDRAIAGNSMGGHGALRLALLYPETFSAVAALSPGIWKPDGLSAGTGPSSEAPADREKWYPRTTGETFDLDTFNAQSPFALIDRAAAADPPVDILLAVGDDDYWKLHDGTVEFYIELRKAGLHPELRVDDGGHDWKYWRPMVVEVFGWFDSLRRPE